MTRYAHVYLAAAVVLALASQANAQGVKSDQDTLIELEQKWNTAFQGRDAAFIETLLDNDFVVTYDDGTRGDKAKELSLAAAFNQQIDSSTQDEFIIKVYGNTAVVWFTLHLLGPVNGKPTPISYRYVDVWVNRDGVWKCVASQSTRIGGKG